MDAEEKSKKKFQPQIERRLHGRTFQKNGSHNDKIYYRCATIGCHATAFAKSDNVLHMGKNAHASHCEDDGKDDVVAMKHWMKTELQDKWWKFLELYEEACQKFDDAAGKVSLDRTRSTLKVWRLKSFPPTPVTMKQFAEQLNEGQYDKILKYKTHKLEFSVVIDENNDMHILFYDREFINTNLKRIMQMFVDATFYTRPKLKDCMQLLTILGIYLGRAVSMFHVLMSKRTKKAYLAVFKEVVTVNAFATLLMIMSDFEDPLRYGLAKTFPLAKIIGCNFHFDKAIYGKLKTLKLIDEIKSSPDLENTIKKILALAFLPKHMIIGEYYRQKESMEDDTKDMLSNFLAYFERYWLGIVTPAGFSVFGLTNRSNNIPESYNSELTHLLGMEPVAADMTQKLVIITVKTRTQVEQRKNLQYGSTLPRYQTQYKDAELKKGWIKLLDPDSNFPAEQFVECAAKLKGNLNEKLKNLRNGLITLQTEMTTKPTVVPMSKDPEFDLSLVMDSASRRVYEQMKRQPRNEDQRIPHLYQQNGGQVTLQRLEDQARAIIVTMEDDADLDGNGVQQCNSSNEEIVHDRQLNISHTGSEVVGLKQPISEPHDSEGYDDDEVMPPKRRRIGVFQSQTVPEDRNFVSSQHNVTRQSSSQQSFLNDLISAASNAHIQNATPPLYRHAMESIPSPTPTSSKNSVVLTPKSPMKGALTPTGSKNSVVLTPKSPMKGALTPTGSKNSVVLTPKSPMKGPLTPTGSKDSVVVPTPKSQINAARNIPDWLTNNVLITEKGFESMIEEIHATAIPDTQDDQETNKNVRVATTVIEDSDIDIFASDDEDSVISAVSMMLPTEKAVIVSDPTDSTSRIIPVKETITPNKRKSKKKNRPGLNDRLKHMQKAKTGETPKSVDNKKPKKAKTAETPKSVDNKKPKKTRKRYKKKKKN